MMNDLESYLKENYYKVETLPNGTIYCVDRYSNELYIPANYSGNIGMYSYMPGINGSGDAYVLRQELSGDNPPQYIVCISRGWSGTHLLPDTYNALTEQGLNITNVCASGFSMSGGAVYESVNELLTEHPEVNATIFVTNSDNDAEIVGKYDQVEALVKNQVPILCIDPANREKRLNYIVTGEETGLNMYYLESSSYEHAWFNNDILYNRFPDFVLGYADDFGNSSLNTSREIVYNLVKIDPITREKIPVNYDEVLNRRVYIPNLGRLLSSGAFNITDNLIRSDEMGVLGGLTELSLKSKTGIISSEYEYVSTWVNDLRKQIKSSSCVSGFSVQGFRSTEGIPGCIGKYLDAYYSLVSDLLTDLSLESESILSYAQAMVDMDDDMAAGAEEIGTVNELELGEDVPASDYMPKPDTPGYYGSPNDTNPQGEETIPEKPSIMEYPVQDNCSAIVRYEGDIAQELAYKYTYSSEEDAKNYYDSVMKIYLNNPYFDHMTLNGKEIYVYMKKSYCEGLTREQISDILISPLGEKTVEV